ncbi:MAG TPA: hypothetical protein PLD41_03020 [Casimicrobium huifangae]|uniref:hypothetical protein n=1 Tax=Casimicrobium huifangae TaxID=2591109 RepID=UPI0012EC6693|nr:hypothetical protein [Casimicrobium huifangae]HOB00455.1 hypothetical protein [Casimicrobium huifangae]HQA32772.1 hypothetical protein [Casimicrobium huifangae]
MTSVTGVRGRFVALVVSLPVLAIALVNVSITVNTVWLYTLIEPFQDQFRLYERYLTHPFPLSVFELENGHRPVLPGLIRWLELRYLDGAQSLQFWTSWGAALAATMAVLICAWRSGGLTRGILTFSVLANTVYWNANARMFVHAYEATHVWYIFAVLVAALMLVGTREQCDWKRVMTACGLAVVATFSFGPGIVVFAAVFVALAYRRERPAAAIFVAVAAATIVLIYTFALPGGDGVRGAAGDDSLLVKRAYFVALRLGAFCVALIPEVAGLGAPYHALVLTASTLLILGTALDMWQRYRADRKPEPFEVIAVGVFVFGIITNVLIAFNRAPHFAVHPQDALADRYLFWSATCWAGTGLYWIARAGSKATPFTGRLVALVAVTALAGFVSLDQAGWWRSWAASTFRLTELTAVAYRHGIPHTHRFMEISGQDDNVFQAEVGALRRSQVMIFSPRRYGPEIGERYDFSPPASVLGAESSVDNKDMPPGSPWNIVSMAVTRVDAFRNADAHWRLMDRTGTLVGACASTGYLRESNDMARYLRRIVNRLDCYVRRDSASQAMLVAVNGREVTVLGTLIVRQAK